MLGRDGAVAGGRAAVLGLVEGVAGRKLPAGLHFAADFGVEAAAAHLALGQIAAVAGPGIAAGGIARIDHARARALDVEHAERGVQTAVEQFSLEAGFIALALDWIE
ncbi:hypothetical protein D3C78_1637170 [compost metagenome]